MDKFKFKVSYKRMEGGGHVEYRIFVGKVLENKEVGTYAHCGSGRIRPEEWDAFVELLPRGVWLFQER